MDQVVPVFMYHQVVPEEELPLDAHLYVTPKTLAQQVLELRKAGYSFARLGDVWEKLEAGTPVGKTAVLTFDDMYDNFYRHAWPLLREMKVAVTAFAICQYVGTRNQHPMVTPGLFGVTEEELREMTDAGVEIGSHTNSHRELTTLPDLELREELSGSRQYLSDVIGAPVRSLCYPRGRFSPRVVRYAEAAGYSCACSTLRGNVQGPGGAFALKRIRAGNERVGWRLRYTLFRAYDWLNRKRTRREVEAFAASDSQAEVEA